MSSAPSVPFALFVRGLRESGIDPNATFQSTSPTYQALNATPEGQQFIYNIALYGAGGPRPTEAGLPAGIPQPTLEYKRSPEQEAKRARKYKKKLPWACPQWTGTDRTTCEAKGQSHCFWKPEAQQCAEYRYGVQHEEPRSPKRSPYTGFLSEGACTGAGGDWTGAFCRSPVTPGGRRKPTKFY